MLIPRAIEHTVSITPGLAWLAVGVALIVGGSMVASALIDRHRSRP